MAEVPDPMARKEKIPPNYGIKFRNSKHQLRFEQLYENRRFVQTRFACVESLEKLELLDQVKGFCEQLGIWKYVTTPVPGYYKLTYEFLSSFEIKREDDYHRLSFQLAGTRREITAQQINAACGFPNPEAGTDPFFCKGPFASEPSGADHQFQTAIFGNNRRS